MSNFKNMWYSSELFLGGVFIGTVISISSSSWMLIWMGMELNMLSFLGWMCTSGKSYLRSVISWGPSDGISAFAPNVEPFAKYFLAQAVGTAFFLFCPLVWGIPSFAPHSVNFLILGMLMKSGVAPLHQWFPSVCSNVSWGVNMMLMFWQKVAPLYIVVGAMTVFGEFFLLVGTLNLFLGVFGALGQTQLRSLFAYSSISHMGWMMATLYFSKVGFFHYFLLYGLMIVPTLNMFKMMKVYSFKDISKVPNFYWPYLLLAAIMVLSVSGMPPFTGFFLKVYTIYLMLSLGYLFLALLFCGFAVLSLAYYINIIFMLVLIRVLDTSGHTKGAGKPVNYKWGFPNIHLQDSAFIVLWVVNGLPFISIFTF